MEQSKCTGNCFQKQMEISHLKDAFLSMRIILEEEISSVEGLAKNEQENIALLNYAVQSLAEPLHLYTEAFESYQKEAIKGDLSTFCEVYREHRKFLMQYTMRKFGIEKKLNSAQASDINRNISESSVDEYTNPKMINQKSSTFEADNRTPVIIKIHTQEGESSGNTPEGEGILLETLSPEEDNSAEHEDLMDNSILPIQDKDSKSKVNSIKTLVLPADTAIIYSGSMSGNTSKVLKVCPFCQAQTANFRRHLRSHNLLEDEVRKLSYRARIRKKGPKKNRKQCPFPICEGLPPHPRLDKHFLYYHKISKLDPIYKKHFVLRRPVVTSEDNYLENIRTEYKKHLKGFGGCLTETVAHAQSLKLKQILKGCEIKNLNTITEPSTIEKLQNWFFDYASTHNPKSATTYISILLNFIMYLKEIMKFEKEDLESLTSKLRKMKKIVIRLNRTQIDHHKSEVSPDQVSCFNKSKTVNDIKESIRFAQDGNQITKAQHSQIRNYLMLKILMRSFCRSGVVANMNIEHYVSKETINENGETFYIIHCNEHKTYETHGAANIILTEDMAAEMDIYYKIIRPYIYRKCHISEETAFFLTWTAKKLTSDDVNKGVKSLWKEARCSGKIGATILRMSSTSRIYKQFGSHEKDLLARLQCHQPTTAERYYRSSTASSEALKASNIAYGIISNEVANKRSDVVTEIDEFYVNSVDHDVDVNTNSETSSNAVEDSLSIDYEGLIKDKQSSINHESDWERYVCSTDGRGRAFFSLSDRKIILNHFTKDI